MAWRSYYVNSEKIYGLDEEEKDVCLMYDSKVPPHGGIREEWTTRGMKNGTSKILFVEYCKEDDDPDGVWEAYGMKAESVYTFTVNAKEADPEKLFVYTLYKDGKLGVGFDIDTDTARAILVFPEPQNITAEQLLDVAKKTEDAPRVQGAVEQIVAEELLNGVDDMLCLAFFNF
ncbi:MAG: hypothetical protein IJB42_06265 [Oscillospiraceae bacterium]|nr:hypothetical protein [Oscillospiraceae bacterium]